MTNFAIKIKSQKLIKVYTIIHRIYLLVFESLITLARTLAHGSIFQFFFSTQIFTRLIGSDHDSRYHFPLPNLHITSSASMKPTTSLLHQVEAAITRQAPRLRQRVLAQTVIERAETAAATSDVNPYFAQLPKPLADFFAKYPPTPYREYADKPTSTEAPDANPFLPNQHPITKRVHDPVYSRRRQSDLYKAAYRNGIAHLLPKMAGDKKFYEEKYETKTPVKGSVRFKLSKAERKAPERKKEMEEALAKADELIAKARGARFKRRLAAKAKQPMPWF